MQIAFEALEATLTASTITASFVTETKFVGRLEEFGKLY